MKLSELIEKHLQQNEGRLKWRTVVHTKIALEKLIFVLGDVDCAQVTRDKAKDFQAALAADENIGPNSVNSYIRSVSPIFTTAIDSGLIDGNPFFRLPKLRKARKAHHIYSDEEIKRLLEHTDYFMQIQILLALTCGLRRGECLWLTWGDIDLENNRVYVRGKDASSEILAWQPKDYSIRALPLEPILKNWLRPTNTQYVALPDTVVRKLLRQPQAEEMSNIEAVMTRKFMRLRDKLGINGTFHDLRATAITRWIKARVKPTDVQYLAGHSSIETTMIYFELVESESTEAARGKIGVSGLEPPTFGPPARRSVQTELHPVRAGVA